MSKEYLSKLVGKVSAIQSAPGTADRFAFWIREDEENPTIIEVSDIVVAKDDDNYIFGLVTEVEHYTDAQSYFTDFYSHDSGNPNVTPRTERTRVTVGKASLIKSTSGKVTPVRAGSIVHFASPKGVEEAYGFKEYEVAIPAGMFQNGDGQYTIVSCEEKFLLGYEGAHFNISGMSGLATKTSYAMFLLTSIFQKARRGVAAVVFNVKAADLLYIDEKNPDLFHEPETQEKAKWQEEEKRKWQALGLCPEPFSEAKFFVPRGRDGKANSPRNENFKNTSIFSYSLSGARGSLLHLYDPEDVDDKLLAFILFLEQEYIPEQEINTFKGLIDSIREGGRKTTGYWWEGHHKDTINKALNRLQFTTSAGTTGVFVYDDPVGKKLKFENLNDRDVWVIDIEKLSDKEQRFVFGQAVEALASMLEAKKSKVDSVLVFVDELNKFAPSVERSPIKSRLIEITARGRSIGLVFFGAEQFASVVDHQVIGNTGTFAFGRTDTGELSRPLYSVYSRDIRAKMAVLSLGHLLLKHALYTQPIFIEFPYPAYKQRA